VLEFQSVGVCLWCLSAVLACGVAVVVVQVDVLCVMAALTCRVQYLNDIDPFAYTTNFPEPPRPPVHTFSATLPLINQLAAVHRLLRAPHRVSEVLCEVFSVIVPVISLFIGNTLTAVFFM